MQRARVTWREWILGVFLAEAAIAVFGQTLRFGFVDYDDNIYVTQNYLVRGGLTLDGVARVFSAPMQGLWHPLTWLSYMLDYQVFGLNPAGFHATSVALHVLNTLLLFAVLRNLTGASWRAAFVAAVFAVHPLNVEAVAWISSRKDVLYAGFWLVTLGCYTAYVRRPRRAAYALVVAGYLAALAAKPMAITLPVVLCLLDVWPLGRYAADRAPRTARRAYALLREKAPLFALAAAFAALAVFAAHRGGSLRTSDEVSLAARLGNPAVFYVKYLAHIIWPVGLSANYPLPHALLPGWQVASSWALLAALTAVAVFLRTRAPYVLVGWLWFLTTLAPVAGFIPIGDHSLADRYTYIAMLGPVVALTWGATDLVAGRPYAGLSLGIVAAAVLLALGPLAWIQTRTWRDTEKLFERMVEIRPDSVVANTGLGHALLLTNRLEGAEHYLGAALALNPRAVDANVDFGLLRYRQGRPAEAAKHYETALGLDPDNAKALNNLGVVLVDAGRYDEAIECYQAALHAMPEAPDTMHNLGNVLLAKGDADGAVRWYGKALALEPGRPDIVGDLGAARLVQKRYADAERLLRKALERVPDDDLIRVNLALVLAETGRRDEALRQVRQALAKNPHSAKGRAVLNYIEAQPLPKPNGEASTPKEEPR